MYECPLNELDTHYEFDADNEELYWEPSNREDKLKTQLQKLQEGADVSKDSLE